MKNIKTDKRYTTSKKKIKKRKVAPAHYAGRIEHWGYQNNIISKTVLGK